MAENPRSVLQRKIDFRHSRPDGVILTDWNLEKQSCYLFLHPVQLFKYLKEVHANPFDLNKAALCEAGCART